MKFMQYLIAIMLSDIFNLMQVNLIDKLIPVSWDFM